MKEGLVFHDWHHAFDGEFERTEKIAGTTKKQREWVKRAWQEVYGLDEGMAICGFPIIKDGRFILHGKVEKTQIHHIVPRGWASAVLGWDERQVNSPLNLYPLCETHHLARGLRELDYYNNVVPAIHPDMEMARKGYMGKNHPTSYDFAFQNREEMMARFEEYWNDDWTQGLLKKAEEVYYRYLQLQLELRGEYYDKFPYRK